jgi:TonB family protein
MATPITLRVYRGDALIATRDFERDLIKIGRLASAHLSIDDDKLSRIHAVLDAHEDHLSITDMGSHEGTFVNGKRVNKATLQWGDEVRLGSTRLIVERRTAAEAAVVVPTAPALAAPVEVAAPSPVEQPLEAARAAPVAFASEARAAVPAPPPVRPRAETAHSELGLQVRFTWGDQLLSVFQLAKPTAFKVGSTPAARFHLDTATLGADEFELVKGGSDFVIRLPTKVGELDDARGPVALGECTRLTPDGGGYALRMSPRDFVWAELGGGVRVEFSFAPMPRKVFVPIHERLDFQFANMLLLVLFMVGGFVIAAKNMDLSDDSLADDLGSRKAVVAKFMLKAEEQQKKNPFLEKLATEKKSQTEASARAARKEGAAGKKDLKPDAKAKSAQKGPDPKAKDRARTMVSQLFTGSGGVSTLFSKGGLASDLKNATANLTGSVAMDSGGMNGLGTRGMDSGGNGQNHTVGIGAVGTHGKAGGDDTYGKGQGDLGKKAATGFGIDQDPVDVQGSVDKELIRQVIHRNRQQIRYCYEAQLTRFPKLEGKVAVTFVIGPEGTVQQARTASSTVSNPELESCLVARFKSWQFPKPKGGGIAQVTYPVVLTQSGAR